MTPVEELSSAEVGKIGHRLRNRTSSMELSEMRSIKPLRSPAILSGLVLVAGLAIAAQEPAAVDTSKIGPPVGSTAPDFAGRDQNGVARTLNGAAGRKGTMLVFFRSADW
ncbi:MAG: hypothetical protein ABI665_08110 [Vicinamibacterales bacterium]